MKLLNVSWPVMLLCLSACSMSQSRSEPPPQASVVRCADCGRVQQLQVLPGKPAPPPSAGVLGSVLGKPSPAAAAGPATYRVTILMDDGRRMVLEQRSISPRLRAGSVVKVSNGRVVLLR